MTRNNNDALKMGIVVCFFALFLPYFLAACDMSAFVQGEFAARCQLLLDLCDKTAIARKSGHPDVDRHIGNLSREWVRFYLAHGNHATMPPTLTFIASSSWHAGLNEVGQAIAALTRTGLSEDDYEILRFRISLLKDEKQLAIVHKVFAGRSASEGASEHETDIRLWLEKSLFEPVTVMSDLLRSSPMLFARLENMANEHISTAARFETLTASEPAELAAAMAASIKEAVKSDMSFWQRLFFCEPAGSL